MYATMLYTQPQAAANANTCDDAHAVELNTQTIHSYTAQQSDTDELSYTQACTRDGGHIRHANAH
jgi:hypothetical protein